MKTMFTVEESNLISIFAGESRTEIIQDISRALKYLEDNVLMGEWVEPVEGWLGN